MSSSQQPDRSRLDEYLDGTMPAQEREAFAREIAANPELQAEIELQNRINQSLSQYYVPPVAPADLGQILTDSAPLETSTTSSAAGKAGTSSGTMIVAAIVVIAIWGGLLWYFFKPAPQPPSHSQVIELVPTYRSAIETGFRPSTVLGDSKDFTKVLREHFGKTLRIKPLPSNCKLLGVTQSDACGGGGFPISIYAQVDGKPVMVFARTAGGTAPEQPSTESKLKLFRKEIGPLVLYELTPHDKAKVTELFELADEAPKQ